MTVRSEHPTSSRLGLAAAGLTLAVVAAIGYWNRGTLGRGFARLGTADPRWLAVAALAAGLLWLTGTISQAGAVRVRVPFGPLCAVQVASSFADHVMPSGCGTMAVNARFLRRQGLSRSAAASAVLVRTFVGWAGHVVLLLAIVLWRPDGLGRVPEVPWWAWPAGLTVLAGVGAATARLARKADAPGWTPLRRLRAAARDLRDGFTVMRDWRRAAALWGGSLVGPVLHSVVLYAVARSIGVQLALVHVLVLYLAAAAVTGIVPAPGAVGALDVALIAALVAAGVPGTTAAGATIAYRMITVWLPLLPAGALLVLLIRRRVV